MIGVLTYSVPHRKTYDVLSLLKAKGVSDIIIFACEFHYEKKFFPLINHRPEVLYQLTSEQLASALGYEYVQGFDETKLPAGSAILICGGGIIPQELIERYVIINSHPGYLPNVRGLDALKWAIYDGQPVGVTVHTLCDEVDAGALIDRQLVPLYFNDTFHSFAYRQYEMEVRMLVEALDKLNNLGEIIRPGDFPLRRRMSHKHEIRLFERFNEMVSKIEIE
ncbi:MAG: phosphoribosylglycinamide formyltransferase [Oscillospiraceae bacterium]|jgi:phosphoribosylglycinamide formyltransferase-1|nr:phosphoribosylglycinamide formyltransferase [Oscillospiraceae bacterium]